MRPLSASLIGLLLLPVSLVGQEPGPLAQAPTTQGIITSASGNGLGTWEAFAYRSFSRWPRRFRIYFVTGRIMDVVPRDVKPGPVGDFVSMTYREYEVPGSFHDTPASRWIEVSSGQLVLMDRRDPDQTGWEARYLPDGDRGSTAKPSKAASWSWIHLVERPRPSPQPATKSG